VLLKQN